MEVNVCSDGCDRWTRASTPDVIKNVTPSDVLREQRYAVDIPEDGERALEQVYVRPRA